MKLYEFDILVYSSASTIQVLMRNSLLPFFLKVVLLRRHYSQELITNLMCARTSDRIFVKPLPSFLINYSCFEKNISPDMSLLASALGFLHTYINMIEYHADFSLAKDLGLLPSTVTWRAWNLFRMDIQQNITQSHQINKRYHYGELRLSRLNSIYRVHQRSWRGGYFLVHTRYQSFFRANFEWLLLAFAYISVALSALQVLVTTNQSQQNMSPALKGVSLGIGTASIVSVMTVVLVMLALFITLRVTNEAFAKSKSVYVEHDFALGDLKVSSFKVL